MMKIDEEVAIINRKLSVELSAGCGYLCRHRKLKIERLLFTTGYNLSIIFY